MKNKISVLGCLALCVLVAALTFQLTFHFVQKRFQEQLDSVSGIGADYGKFAELDGLIRSHYLGTVDSEAVEDGAFRGYVAGLGDPYSKYLNPEEYSAYLQSLSGAVSGVGIRATQDPDSGEIVVYGVLSGSPAEEAGVRKGDIVNRIDDEYVSDLGFTGAMRAMTGDAGSKVKISFLRDVAAKQMELSFTFVRADVTVNSVSYEIIEDLGYIQIFSFDLETDREFQEAVESLLAANARALLIDLRNNGGGSLDAATRIMDQILPAGVMYYRSGADGKELAVESGESRLSLPITVLVNENSASAAELLAAVLQDQGAATLVGTKTYGKGTGQKVVEMEDGSALIISSERFRPAKSASFHEKGVMPDVVVPLDGTNIYLLSREKDNQLQEAIQTLAPKE